MPLQPTSYVQQPYVRGQNVGELLRLRGSRAADAELRSGDITAQMFARLGEQISGSINSYAQQRQDAPRRAQEDEARRIGLQNARTEQASAAKATEDRSILGSAQGSGLDPESVKSQLQQMGRGDLVPIYEQTHATLETARLGLQEKRAAVKAQEADYFGGIAAGIKRAKFDPIAIEWGLKQAEADGHDVAPIRQRLQQNPESVQQMIDSLIEQSPTQREAMGKEQDRALSQAREDRALAASQQLQTDREDDNKRADAAAVALQRDREADNRRADRTAARAGSGDNEPLEKIVGPDGKVVYARRSDAVGKTPGAGTEKSSSGVQKRVLNFFNRAEQADKDLEALEPEIEKLNVSGQAWQAMAPNFAQTQLGQSYTAAQRAFTEARLRKDSGAAIPPHEFESDRKTYFVQTGDSKKTIQDKNRARAAMLASLAFESGQALGEFVGDADEAHRIVEGYKARSARPEKKADPLGLR